MQVWLAVLSLAIAVSLFVGTLRLGRVRPLPTSDAMGGATGEGDAADLSAPARSEVAPAGPIVGRGQPLS